jgi:SAM-dependent methyltransferase
MTEPANHSWVGLRDAVLSGWFVKETGEVFEGIPVTADDIVLDVGCGNGGVAGFCAALGASIILADTDPDKIAAAKNNLAMSSARSVQALVTDSNPLPLSNGAASIVISTEVLEHVDDTRKFLAELVRVGRPGARYLLTVPDPAAETLQKTLAPPSYWAKPNHIRIIGRDEFGEMVEAAGLIIERRTSYSFFWALWWVMFWACDVEINDTDHPVLKNWTESWSALLETKDGIKVKKALDGLMPKSQIIIARKP